MSADGAAAPRFGAAEFNRWGREQLPGHLGVEILGWDGDRLLGELAVRRELMAPNGFLHAGSVVTLADTVAGYACVARLPEGASGFTTLELKANFLGTARAGRVRAVARPVHIGRTTQVWDVEVEAVEDGRTLALFRCTQLVLYPKAA